MTRLPRGWVPPVAVHQDGLFTRAQAWTAGASQRQVQLRVASGEWVRTVGDALAPAGLPMTPVRHVTAVGLTWSHAVTALTTAATLHELPVPAGPEVHVFVDRRTRSRDGVRTHVRRLGPGDIAVAGRGLVTSRRRTVLDCIAWLPDGDSEALVAWAVTRRLVTPQELGAAVEARARRWGTPRLRRAATDAGDGTLSAAERRLRRLLRRAGITGYAFDQPVTDADGIVGRADVLFARERLVVEVDGYAYHSVRQFQSDRDKQNRLMLAGYTVLRFTWADLVQRPEHVVAQIRRTLATLRRA